MIMMMIMVKVQVVRLCEPRCLSRHACHRVVLLHPQNMFWKPQGLLPFPFHVGGKKWEYTFDLSTIGDVETATANDNVCYSDPQPHDRPSPPFFSQHYRRLDAMGRETGVCDLTPSMITVSTMKTRCCDSRRSMA
jgi:hypothetical protein